MIHTIDDIKRKYKEYLTKAQIRELAKRDLLYRQTHSAERAEALGTIRSEYEAGRRALQNMGLASRQGNLISGKEKAMRAPLERQYVDYSRDLHRIEHGYTERDAVNMANENIRARAAAARRRAEEAARKEAEERAAAEQAYRLKTEVNPRNKAVWNTMETDTGTGTPYWQTAEGLSQTIRDMGGTASARQAMIENAHSKAVDKAIRDARSPIARSRFSEQDVFRAQKNISDPQYRFMGDFGTDAQSLLNLKDKSPQTYDSIYSWYNYIDENRSKWDAAIAKEKSTPASSRDAEAAKRKADEARHDMARAQSALVLIRGAADDPEHSYLYMESDKDFQVQYDAAKRIYDNAIEYASGLKKHNPQEARKREKEAVEAFAPFDRAYNVRGLASEDGLYAQYVDTDESLVPKAPAWARPSEWNGTNWKNAYNRKWSAETYEKTHDTKGSKYDALVNEWSLINGRTALLYAQKFSVINELADIKEIIGQVFGGDVNRDHAYRWFVNECNMAFRHNQETSGSKPQKEQMESMLTLANLMTDEERAKFNTILERDGADEADKYFEYLYNNILPDVFVKYVTNENAFDTRTTDRLIGQSLLSTPVNLIQGVSGPLNSMQRNANPDLIAERMTAMKYNTAQQLRDTVSGQMGKTGAFLYGTGMSMLDSAAVALISQGIGSAIGSALGEASTITLKSGKTINLAQKAGSAFGGALLGGSAFNSAYVEALDRGLSPETARTIALGNGVNEMLFEAVSLDLLVSRFKTGDIIKASKNGFVNWAVNTLVEAGVEGSEEVFTDLANKMWDNNISGIYSEEMTKLREYMRNGDTYEQAKAKIEQEFESQLGASFLGGAISGGVMGGGAGAVGMLRNKDVATIGRNLDDAAKAEIRAHDFQNAEAREILEGKLTDEDYGLLAMTRLEEMARTDPIAAEKAAQSLIDAMARTDVKVNKRNQTLKTGTDNSVSFDYDGVTDVKKMSGVQVEALRFAQTLVKSKVGGVNINVANQLFDKNGNEQNGWYDAKTNTVHVSLNGSQSVVYTISHELTHRLKSGNEEAYASMRDAMKDELESLDLTGSDLPEEYENILGDYLVKDGEQRSAWEALIEYEMDRYKKHNIDLDRESAEEEVVCRACETMLERSRLISSMISKNVRGAKTVAKFLASIYDDIASLKEEAESRGYVDGSPEKLFIDQYTDVEKIANAWASAMKTVSEKEEQRKPRTERIAKSKNGDYARLSKSETAKASGNIDVTDDITAEGEDGKPLSIKSLDFDMHSGKMYKDLVEHGVMTEEEVVKYDRFLKALIAYIKPNRAFLDMNESYTKDNRPFTAFKDNSDPLYKLSLDFSTLCRKRLTTQYIIEKLQMKLKKALSAEEQLAVRAMLKDYQKIDKGLQVACGMCYVEAARYKSPKQINMWLESDGRRKAMVQYFAVTDKQFTETVKQKQAEWKARHGYADNATKKEMSSADVTAFNKMSYDLRQSYEMDDEHQAIMDKALALPKEQFLSAANLAELAEGDEAERTIYNAYTRFIRAATRSKSLEADIPYYYGDSESRVSDTFIENVNAENGMRFDSWSDFQFTHLLDMITAITDLSVRGSAMHGYTKFPEFVRMFGKTGAMFNLSGVPQGIGLKQDGSLDFSPTESINEEEAIKLREEFPETAGFQSIGINDRHINALLDSDFIDYVIPYHVSGMNAKLRSIAKIAGWSNYQDVQNAKIDRSLDGNKAKCDPSVWHVEPVFSEFFVGYNTGMNGIDAMRASAQRYVDMCHERGLKPKFEKFLKNDNYWKLLIDRKMINQKTGALIEQKAVKPNFDLDTIKREIDKYVNSYDQNREENAFNYIVDRWDEVPALVAKLEKEGRAEKKRQQEAAKNIDMLKGEMVNAVPGHMPMKAAAQKFSIKENDAQYMDLARRYESGDKSVEAELRKQVDAAAKRAGYNEHGFHRTSANFYIFDRAKQGTRFGGYSRLGKGFYFAHEYFDTQQYSDGSRVIEAYLSMKKPYDGRKPMTEDIKAKVDEYYKNKEQNGYDPTYPISKEQFLKNLEWEKAVDIGTPSLFLDHFKYDKNGKMTDGVRDFLESMGYDGIITDNEMVVFDPSQIKSADLITKDDSGNIIPLSERFKTDRTGEEAWKNEDIRFSIREEAAPTKTQDVYKLMRLGKDGRLYPLFIDSAEGIDVGVWYNADSPDMSDLKTLPSGVYLIGNDGEDIVTLADYQRTHGEKASKFPSKSAINSAANDGKRWVFIEDVAKAQRRYGGENRKYWNLGINGSGSVSTFAMRPGWHAGSLPTMRQIGKGANRNLRDDTFVWVKGRVSADVDYQAEASQNPDNDIPTHIPTNGFYMKATNPNATAAQTDTVGWYIAGAFIADKIMSDSEARNVIDDWNANHPSDHVEYDWERESGGEFDAETMSIRNAKYSLKESDSQYMDLARRYESGDKSVEADLRKAVDAAAKAAGYTIKAWHGTHRFGRTKFTSQYGALFLSSNPDVGQAFSGDQPVRAIAKQANPDTMDIDEAARWYKQNVHWGEFRVATDADFKQEIERLQPLPESVRQKYHMSEEEEAWKDKARKKVESKYSRFLNGEKFYYFEYNGINHDYGNSPFADVNDFRNVVRERLVKNDNGGGVYEMYISPKNMITVDANGAYYASIPLPSELRKYATAEEKRIGKVSSDQLLRIADEAGYDTIEIKNVVEGGDYGRTAKATDYVVMNPESQAKSADLITKDDSGNIIPLSERFNEKEEDIRRSIMDKEFRMTKQGAVRTFEQRDTTATVIGSSVELEGGSLLNRVRMMQNLAEEYGSVTVDAKSEKEAEAFKRAGAKKETDAFSGSEYGTWAFEHQENKYETDTQYDAKQKRQFANDVLKEIGTRKNFTLDELVRYRAALEKTFAVLHNSTYGKGDQLAAYEYADKLFDRMLDSYAEMSEADADMRDTLLSNMTRATDSRGRMYRVLEVTAKQMSEIKNAYESAAAYGRELSKALGSKVFVKETANAKTLEDIFTHSTDTRFNAETNEGDMPGELLKIAEQTKEQRTNPYKAESAEREAMKAQLWDKAIDIVGVEKSTAQKVREAVREARAEERAKAKTKVQTEVEKARLAERMHEGALRAQERRASATREAAIKQRAADREAKLKETTKQRLEQQRLEQLRRDTKTVALKWNQRLVKMLANPTEASHIPVQLAREVAEFTGALTRFLDSGTERGQINLAKIAKAYQQSFADAETIEKAKAENPNYDPRGLIILDGATKETSSNYDAQLVKMIDELNDILQGKTLKDLSAFEMRMLLNTVRGVAHTVYDANRMIGQNERKAIWQVGSQMVDQLENAPKISKGMRGYLETSLDLRRLALAFSGSNKNAEFVKLVEQLNDGAIEKERVAQVLQDMFKTVTDTYGKEIRTWYGKNAEWIDTGITKNGKKVEITKGMRVSLAMHVLNEGNMRHIENGGLTIPDRELYRKGNLSDAYANGELVRLNAEQINEIISHMTDAEKAYVETAKEFFHKRTGYYVNKTSLQLLGYRKATVDNYFPIHTDRNFTKTDFASLKMDGSIEGQGFLKERVNASNPVYLEDITSVVNRQIRGVALYAGLAVPMRNFNAVMNAAVYEDDNGVWSPRTTVKQTMTKTMGEYGSKIVEGFLTDVSEMSHVDVTPMERFAGKLATNYVKAVLLGNLKVAMKQVASYPTAAAVIPWKYLSKALVKGGRNGRIISRADVDLINQYTPLYQMRREGNANEIASVMQRKGLEQKLPWLLGWITKMDVMTVGRLWSAAEYMVADQQKNLTVGSDEYYKAVAKVFNDTVQQTQPNFTPLQRNAALRSKNPIVRSLVLFGTQRMQNGGILIEAALELKNSKGKSKAEIKAARAKLGRAVASQIVQNILLLVASAGVDVLRGRMKGWQDKDKEITVESVSKNLGDSFLSNFVGSFLGGSEVYSAISGLYKTATGETAYDTEFTVPALDAIETIINFAQSDIPNAVKYLSGDHTDDEKKKKLLNVSMQLAKVAGYATGIPLENAVKDVFKGIIPAVQDVIDWKKTGELNPWLHQSGKLDSKKSSTNYKEWTKLGYKGSTYFYWENKMNDVSGGREGRIPLLEESDLTNEQKAKLMELFDTSGATSKGTVVYNKKGEIIIDFSNPDK